MNPHPQSINIYIALPDSDVTKDKEQIDAWFLPSPSISQAPLWEAQCQQEGQQQDAKVQKSELSFGKR